MKGEIDELKQLIKSMKEEKKARPKTPEVPKETPPPEPVETPEPIVAKPEEAAPLPPAPKIIKIFNTSRRKKNSFM